MGERKAAPNEQPAEKGRWVNGTKGEEGGGEGKGLPVRKQLSRESRHLAARRLPGVSYIDLVWLISRLNFVERSMIRAANQPTPIFRFTYISILSMSPFLYLDRHIFSQRVV